MTKNKKQKKVSLVILAALIFFILIYYFVPKEIRFEEVSFRDSLVNRTETYVPYELHFSIVNTNFKDIECTSTLRIYKEGQINKSTYNLGRIQQRTKFKYKIPFNMPIGNTTLGLIKNCTII